MRRLSCLRAAAIAAVALLGATLPCWMCSRDPTRRCRSARRASHADSAAVHGYSAMLRQYQYLMKDGYIFAFQDTRGRGASTGHYITLASMRDESVPTAFRLSYSFGC